jgi:hypothetical protein
MNRLGYEPGFFKNKILFLNLLSPTLARSVVNAVNDGSVYEQILALVRLFANLEVRLN